ncbi:hypothetical protein [Cellulomonas iranensis]|uniref:hypothetical protein n=1 Tax=Cellulomonas iranensis TaxID=76862 RepID=UPI0013D0B5F3|nr:hypothetical protein [Cellulomonas iranensis]
MNHITTPTPQDERLASRAIAAYDALGRRGITDGPCAGLAIAVAETRAGSPGEAKRDATVQGACAVCPQRLACLGQALVTRDVWHVAGGRTVAQRAALHLTAAAEQRAGSVRTDLAPRMPRPVRKAA